MTVERNEIIKKVLHPLKVPHDGILTVPRPCQILSNHIKHLPSGKGGAGEVGLQAGWQEWFIKFISHLLCREFEGHKVSGKDNEGCLKELMDVCVMCNDSELSYNEVRDGEEEVR